MPYAKKPTVGLALGLTLILVATARSQVSPGATDAAPLPRDGVLVLHGGEVLRGKITHAGDRYYVVLPHGEIRISSAKVAMACDTLDEAYARKRAAIRVGNAHDHLELAEWCQQQGLFSAAARELADALAADPTNPMIPYLERRLKLSLDPAPSGVATASSTATKAASAGPTLDDLDLLTRSMPPGTMEAFTTTIQPLLVNHCAAAECHGARTQGEFRLLRGHPGRPPSRRMTQRNLYATLQLLNREQPQDSPLLTVPLQPHGDVAKEVFTERDGLQYRQIAEWVRHVTRGDPSPARPATVTRRDGAPIEAMSTAAASGRRSAAPGRPIEPNGTPASDCPFDAPTDASSAHRAAPRPASTVQHGAVLPQFTPADPFDPAIFNRRFSPDGSPIEDDRDADDGRPSTESSPTASPTGTANHGGARDGRPTPPEERHGG